MLLQVLISILDKSASLPDQPLSLATKLYTQNDEINSHYHGNLKSHNFSFCIHILFAICINMFNKVYKIYRSVLSSAFQ